MRLATTSKKVIVNLAFSDAATKAGKEHVKSFYVLVSDPTLKRLKTIEECRAFGEWVFQTYFKSYDEEKFFPQQALPMKEETK